MNCGVSPSAFCWGEVGITRGVPARDGNTRPPGRAAVLSGGALKPCFADSRKSAAACASSRNGLGGGGGEERGWAGGESDEAAGEESDDAAAGDGAADGESVELAGAIVGAEGACHAGWTDDGRSVCAVIEDGAARGGRAEDAGAGAMMAAKEGAARGGRAGEDEDGVMMEAEAAREIDGEGDAAREAGADLEAADDFETGTAFAGADFALEADFVFDFEEAAFVSAFFVSTFFFVVRAKTGAAP